jgi:hypothetical protein
MHFSYSANVKTDEQKFIQTNKWAMETMSSTLTPDEKISRLLDVLRLKATLAVPDKIWPYGQAFHKVKADVVSLIKILPADNPHIAEYRAGLAGAAFTFGMNCLTASLPTTQDQPDTQDNPLQFSHPNNNDADSQPGRDDQTPPSKRARFNK